MSEVVVMMPPEDDDTKRKLIPAIELGAKASDSQFELVRPVLVTTNFGTSSSPDHATLLTPTANKPPRPSGPETLTRRRSLARSVYSKPKSRFVEQRQPASAYSAIEESGDGSSTSYRSPTGRAPLASPLRTPVGTPKGIVKAGMTPRSLADEEEEEIVREYITTSEKWRRKLSFWVILEWVAFITVTCLLVASLFVPKLRQDLISGLELWKWCLLVMVIFSGRLVTAWFITILVYIKEMNFMLKKKVLYFVYGIKKSVQLCLWCGLVLLTWGLLFDRGAERSERTKKFLNYLSRTLATILIGSVLWLVKTLLVKLLASSFHVNTFFDRIQESIFHQYILQTLSGPPLMEMAENIASTAAASTRSKVQLSFRSARGRGEVEEQTVIDVAILHKMNQNKVSAHTMKKLIHTITSTGLWTISNTLDQSVYEDDDEQKDKEITSELEAKAAAYQIFKKVAKQGAKYIDEEDLLRFLSKEELEIVLPQFEGALETRKIKKSAMRNWVVSVYLERKSLAHSLNDTKTAVRQLNRLISVVVIIVVLIAWVLMMQFATTKVLVFISSQLLLIVFMFGNTCKMIFEAIIFVFVTHPFDVGDRCVIDGVQMVVEETNILTTVFLRYDNEKVYYPNAVLATKPISNFYRSPDMGDSVDFSIDVYTPMDTIKAMKDRVKKYIDGKPHHWRCNHNMIIKEIENMNKMKMTLFVTHTMNFQDMAEKNNRRTLLIFELKKIFEDLGIKYRLLPQEVHLAHADDHSLNFSFGR